MLLSANSLACGQIGITSIKALHYPVTFKFIKFFDEVKKKNRVWISVDLIGYIPVSKQAVLVYLSCTALTANHQRLVNWLKVALNIPVGFLRHNKDMWFELLQPEV